MTVTEVEFQFQLRLQFQRRRHFRRMFLHFISDSFLPYGILHFLFCSFNLQNWQINIISSTNIVFLSIFGVANIGTKNVVKTRKKLKNMVWKHYCQKKRLVILKCFTTLATINMVTSIISHFILRNNTKKYSKS